MYFISMQLQSQNLGQVGVGGGGVPPDDAMPDANPVIPGL